MPRAKQTVTVKKEAAPARREASRIARPYADRIWSSRGTKGLWRFRQRPPSCFRKGPYRTWCRKDGVVCVIYGTLKPGARKRRACR